MTNIIQIIWQNPKYNATFTNNKYSQSIALFKVEITVFNHPSAHKFGSKYLIIIIALVLVTGPFVFSLLAIVKQSLEARLRQETRENIRSEARAFVEI